MSFLSILVAFSCLIQLANLEESIYSDSLDSLVYSSYDHTIYEDIISGVAPTTHIPSNIVAVKPYNPSVRPNGTVGLNTNIDSNGALYLNVEMDLKQLVSLDEVGQVLTSQFYLQVSWADPRLSWNPASYKNVKYITVLASKV